MEANRLQNADTEVTVGVPSMSISMGYQQWTWWLYQEYIPAPKTIGSRHQNNLDEYNDETHKQFQQPDQSGAGYLFLPV